MMLYQINDRTHAEVYIKLECIQLYSHLEED